MIVGTAGHVDHGKTALIKALTGVDADTLAEEKRRGITIELGFVFMEGPVEAPQVVFIDVPGHEKLIRTMVAGASSLEAALLVVAADEGLQPQTQEHADILRLLGVTRGVVALTKCDLVDPDQLAARETEVRAFLPGTSLREAEIIPVSAVSGEGVERLRAALLALAETVPVRPDSGLFRMPVDRVFTLHGFGTVIAGTVLAGAVQAGDRVTIYPEGLEARIRSVQVHSATVERAGVGQRAALNAPDLRKENLRRGQCAAAPDSLSPTTRLDVRLLLLGSATELKNRARVRLHVGTEEVICAVVLLDRDRLVAGDEAPAQLLLEAPTVAVHGDRFVVRSLTPPLTIGGGVILDAQPARHRRREDATLEAFDRLEGDFAEVIAQVYLKAEWQPHTAQQVALEVGRSPEEVRDCVTDLHGRGELVPVTGDAPAVGSADVAYLHRSAYERLCQRLLLLVSDYLAHSRYRTYMPAADLQSRLAGRAGRAALVAVLRDLRRQGRVIVTERGLSLPGHSLALTESEQDLLTRLESQFAAAGMAPPAEETVREGLQLSSAQFANLMLALLDRGTLLRLPEKVTIHHAALAEAQKGLQAMLAKEGRVSAGGLRDYLGCSRKHAIALLEYYDGTGLTRREGNERVPGPKFSGGV